MITVWGRANSSNVQSVMWAIAELGLDHMRHDIGHSYGGNDTPEFLAMNPNGTVPVIQDGTNPPLWESGAILRYLADTYGSAPFWPTDSHARADVDRWAEWAKITISMNFTVPIFWRVVRTPPDQRDPRAIAQAVAALETRLSIADTRLAEHAYLVGPDFTLADIQFGHILYRYFDIQIERAPLPALRAYYDRLTQRPAYAAHVMLSYDALRA